MAEIGQQLFAIDGTRNFLRLYKEEFVRPFVAPPWTARLRLAVMVQITDTGGNFSAPDHSFFGLCQGTSRPYGDATPLRVCGTRIRNTSTWTYNAGSGNPYYSGLTLDSIRILNGAVTTSSMSSSANGVYTTTSGTARRSLIIVDVLDGSQIYFKTEATVGTALDFNLFNFLEATEALTPSYAFNGSTTQSFTSNVGAVTSLLDTVNIYWGTGSVPLLVYGMAVYSFPY